MTEGYAKAYFERIDARGERVGDSIEVQFNPNEFGLGKAVQLAEIGIPGLDSPILQFVRGQNETVQIELFFDETDSGTTGEVTSVTEQTNRFYDLVKVAGDEHAPPRCRFIWGEEFPGTILHEGSEGSSGSIGKRHAFDCVVESVQQRFTLFSPEGVPLRATVNLSLREYRTLSDQLQEINLRSADRTQMHTVQRGETLPQIAYQIYRDPAQWRVIAAWNQLLHPRDLTPGMVLELPPMQT
jgi:nucleoid-associated protein YgaU